MLCLQFAQFGIKLSMLFSLATYHARRSFSFVHKLSYLLTYFSYVNKIRPTPKIPVARLARDSNIGGFTRRDRHAITTRLFAFMYHVRTASFVARFTHGPYTTIR
jgi:hypothetical protein